MKEFEDGYKFEEFFNLISEAIKANDIQEINNYLKSIKSNEEFFLKSYLKRKKEGVYYTSKPISTFMSSEVLILILKKRLKNYDEICKNLEKINDIFNLNSSLRQKIYKILINISVCDPACGSGVFLVSFADLVYNIVKKLNPKINPIDLKIKILKNLYGFDINYYAIQLSKLKLIAWLYEEHKFDYTQAISILKKNLKLKNSIFSSNLSKFDIVIGNPPYGNILNKNEKEILKREKVFYNDAYCAFLLKALDWGNGIIGFLVPKSFLLRQGYIEFRNKFLSSANILKIFDIGSNLFKKATNEVQIVLYENKDNKNKNLKIYDYPNKEIITYQNQKTDLLRTCLNLNCPLCEKSKKVYVYTFNKRCPYCYSKTIKLNRIRIKPTLKIYNLLNKIERAGNLNYLNIRDFPKMIRGEEDKGLKQVKMLIKKDKNGTCYFISAKDDFKYYYIKKYKSFIIEEIDPRILKGVNYEYYTNPKLLIKHNNIIPEAAYTEDKVCFTSSIYSLLHGDIYELKYIGAVLNSILIQFYCTYGINNQKDTTINLNQYMIRHLPIVKPNKNLKVEVAAIVDQIIEHLNKNHGISNEEIKQLLRDIDEIIFNLYSITENDRNNIKSLVKKQINFFKNIY